MLANYEEAISLCTFEGSESLDYLREHLAALHNNIGMVYLKISDNVNAKLNLTKSIELMPGLVKPMMHRVIASKNLEDYMSAIADLKKIRELEPD